MVTVNTINQPKEVEMIEAVVNQLTANTQGAGEEQNTSVTMPPLKMSALPAWGMGMAMGEFIAGGIQENNPEFIASLEESGLSAEDFQNVMQGLMTQVTKTLGESTDFLKELDDAEEGCAATEIYNQ
jgi:hypothetical protein